MNIYWISRYFMDYFIIDLINLIFTIHYVNRFRTKRILKLAIHHTTSNIWDELHHLIILINSLIKNRKIILFIFGKYSSLSICYRRLLSSHFVTHFLNNSKELILFYFFMNKFFQSVSFLQILSSFLIL